MAKLTGMVSKLKILEGDKKPYCYSKKSQQKIPLGKNKALRKRKYRKILKIVDAHHQL